MFRALRAYKDHWELQVQLAFRDPRESQAFKARLASRARQALSELLVQQGCKAPQAFKAPLVLRAYKVLRGLLAFKVLPA